MELIFNDEIITKNAQESMSNYEQVKSFLHKKLASRITDFRVTSHFHYYGIFSGRVLLGLYQEKVITRGDEQVIDRCLYLKPTEQVVVLLDKFNFERCNVLNKNDTKALIKRSFCIPFERWNEVFEEQNVWSHLVKIYIEEYSARELLKKKPRIRNLLNLNMKVERTLAKVNITDVQTLFEQGAVKIFVHLIMNNYDVHENLLYKLHGAINKIFYQTISPTRVLSLKKEVNEELKKHNRVNYFKTKDLVLKTAIEMGWFIPH